MIPEIIATNSINKHSQLTTKQYFPYQISI